jgi:hypothetical protein
MHGITSLETEKGNIDDSESTTAVVGSLYHCYIGVAVMDHTRVAKKIFETEIKVGRKLQG